MATPANMNRSNSHLTDDNQSFVSGIEDFQDPPSAAPGASQATFFELAPESTYPNGSQSNMQESEPQEVLAHSRQPSKSQQTKDLIDSDALHDGSRAEEVPIVNTEDTAPHTTNEHSAPNYLAQEGHKNNPVSAPPPDLTGNGLLATTLAAKPSNSTPSSPPSPYLSEKVSQGEAPRSTMQTSRKTSDIEKQSNSSDNDAKLLISAEEDEYDAKTRDVGMFELWRYATRFEIAMNLTGLVCAAAAGAAQPVMTIVFGSLTEAFVKFGTAISNVDNAANAGDLAIAQEQFRTARNDLQDTVNLDAIILLAIGLATFVCTYIYEAAFVYSGENVTRRIRETYLRAVLRQEIAYFDVLGAGEVTARIQTDTHLIQEAISDKIPMSVMFIATFIVGFVIAYVRCWQLALAMSSILPVIAMTGAAMNVFVSKWQQVELNAIARCSTVAEEAMSTVRTAKAFGSEDKLANLYQVGNREAEHQGYKKAFMTGTGLGIMFFVIYSAYGLAFYFGAQLIAGGHATAGDVINVFFAILIGSFSMAMIAPNFQALAKGRGAAGKIYKTIERTPHIDSSNPAGLKPDTCHGAISVNNVNFAYPARKNIQILENFSCNFPAGKVTALVGASGSGKSTIVGLVERFYDPDAGHVTLDGTPLRDLNLKWLRSQIGLVSQEPTLFATTIQGNVEHGLIGSPHENASQEEKTALVIEACKKSNAHGFITALPDGYKTLVGERGFLLSGGQKQRIAIARAVVSDPRILLLDEATSALDTQSEGIVQDALDQASKGRTTITIAHRLSTIKTADKIVVLGKGLILETGTHEELLSHEGPYYHLVSAQKIRAATSTKADEVDEAADEENEKEELRRAAMAEQPAGLDRTGTQHSVSSDVVKQAGRIGKVSQKNHGTLYLLYRLAMINRDRIISLYLPGLLCAVLVGAVYPTFAILFGKAVQTFSEVDEDKLQRDSARNALWFFLVAIASGIVIWIQSRSLEYAGAILCARLRRMTFKAYLRQDVAYFDDDAHQSGILTASLSENSAKINGLVGVTLGTIVQSIATIVVGSAIALAYGWKLALVVLACVPLTLSAGFVRLKVVVLKDAKTKRAHENSAQLACEAASSIRTVASLTREDDCVRIYQEGLKEPTRIIHQSAIWATALFALSQSFSYWVIALGFWYGAGLIGSREYETQQFFTVFMAVVFGSIQAGNVFNFVPDISNASSAANDTINLLDARPEIDSESTEGRKLDHCVGRIRFEDVHFRYPTRQTVKVLRGLDLDIKSGSYVALVGGSGCGKSTTIQLLERFYDPLAGKILVDGQDISELNLKEYRKHIALVSQEPTLYAGTVKFNILLGSYMEESEVTEEMLRNACRDANILDFIESLPDGFETQVGGKGTQLSGGQKQRIAIARALLRNPKILLLDEATSALDSESESVVQAALDQAAKGRTTIAVAHRLSTISRADRIFVLKDGKVGEAGDHNYLMSLKGLYAQLVSLQELQKAN